MKNMLALNRVGFLAILSNLKKKGWDSCLKNDVILLCPKDSDLVFSPITAVYYNQTSIFVHRGSFWQEEIAEYFKIPWWEMLEIAYAQIALSSNGKTYDPRLRHDMLRALGLS